ncbi:MAG: glycoside hydrolase family 2 [Planctomycetes bacterium]|nr:glycoside hydrolase family 2 [Planctomycetota bacterium]
MRYLVLVCTVLCVSSSVWAKWKPAKGPLMTQWAKDVSPKKVHREYPRPQMVRKSWQNLNGLWEYSITAREAEQPEEFDGQILVPFPVESALSGVMKKVGEDNRLWYRRTFKVSGRWRKGKRVLLHFGAVDWDTTVWVNGEELGNHKGGYDAFTFDITDVLKKSGSQEIVLSVWDPTNDGSQPRGKQVKKPGGIMYTAVTGIWQTVWLEPVPETYISGIKIVPDVDNSVVEVEVDTVGDIDQYELKFLVKGGGRLQISGGSPGLKKRKIKMTSPKLWSPDSPFLYDLEIKLMKDKKTLDKVDSYFGMRKIEVKKDEAGINRLFLNDKVLFQYGPLDQGWWPDGLYTAPTDEALRYDIEVLKKLGCNMLRKHVKVEPARLYYWCDKLGLMVWQDMASGNNKGDQAREQFELELKRLVEGFRNHPSIIMWVPFNEGWGQHDTPRYAALVKKWDPTRLVNESSGWANKESGDVRDIHSYPGPARPPNEDKRVAVLGEFGGLGLPVKGHTWQAEKNWGYRSYETRSALTKAYVTLLGNLRPLIGRGLSAAVYTQTTDVEVEVNGYMTYDRAMVKADIKQMAEAARKLYLPPPIIKTIVPTSQEQGIEWSYTTSKPRGGWQKAGFDDSSWKKGMGGFGTKSTPGAVVRTEWNTSDIWLRRKFELKDKNFDQPHLQIHHDEDAKVYINGQLAAELKGYTSDYTTASIGGKGREALKVGVNCIAVHCHQTGGGQYIDVGLSDVVEQPVK